MCITTAQNWWVTCSLTPDLGSCGHTSEICGSPWCTPPDCRTYYYYNYSLGTTPNTCQYSGSNFACADSYTQVSCANGVASTQSQTASCGATACNYAGSGWTLNPAYNSYCNAVMSIAPGNADGSAYAYAGFTMPYTATWQDSNGLSACQIYIDGSWYSKTCGGTSSNYSATLTGYGSHVMQLYEQDANGSLNYSSNYNYTLSVASPAVTLKAGGQTGSTSIPYNSSTTLTWTTADPTAWQNTGKTLATTLAVSALSVIGDSVYLFGGYNGACTDTIYKSLTSDLGTWTTGGGILPVTAAYNTTLVVGDYVYLYGGYFNSAWSNKIYRAPTTNPTVWADTGKTIPGVYGLERAATIGNYVYLFGGYNGSAYTNTIYRAPTTDPTTFTIVTGKTLPGNLGLSQIATTADSIYLFGGYNGSAYTNVIYKALLTDPTTWTNTGKTLPSNLAYSTIIKTADALYLFGGYNGSTALNTIYKAPLTDPTNWTDISNSQTYAYTVPAGVTSVILKAWGAQGMYGGKGGYAKGTLVVTPGQVLNVYVGKQNGYNGGGVSVYSSGGGASDVRTGAILGTRVIVGGGGGTGGSGSYGSGGGTSGGNGSFDCFGVNRAGGGGTQSAGGSGGSGDYAGGSGTAGSLGQGGLGGGSGYYTGNGGGGYYGGGGGGATIAGCGGSSGGGSSYIVGLTNSVTTSGVRTGNGRVTITGNDSSVVSIGDSLPVALYALQSAITNDAIYLFGGIDSAGTYTNAIYKALLTDPTNFTLVSGKTLPRAVALSEAVMVGNSIYLFGGSDGAYLNTIYKALLSDPTTWSSGKLPSALSYSKTATIGDYVYLFGGWNCSAATNVIYKAPTADPTMWTSAGNLPSPLYISASATIGDYIYLFGGYNGSAYVNTIYRAPLTNPTSWSSVGNLPIPIGRSTAAVIGNYVYLFGGYNGSAVIKTIYRAPVSNPLTWTNVGNLPGNLADSNIAIIGDSVYLFGGENSWFTPTSIIYKASVADPLTWETLISALPTTLTYSHIADIGGYLYLFGGYNGSAYVNTIYNTLISAATSCAGTNFNTGGATSNSVGISTGNLFTDKTYTITCTGTGGTSNASVDVLINPKHSVCSGGACVMQDGAGVNICSSNCASASYCGGAGGGGTTGPNWHSICANNACVVADGAGANECSTALDCGGSYPAQYYGVCAQGACVMVEGDPNNNACTLAGEDLCSNYGGTCPNPVGYSFNINTSNDPRVNITKDATGNVCSDGSTIVTIEPLQGFNQTIALSIQDWGGLSGATASFSDANLISLEYAAGSTLTICAPATTPSNNFNITLRGTSADKVIDRVIRVLLHNLKSAGWKEI